jgi:hypothetical protein
MFRRCRAPALAAVLAVVATGCQDYNFNPVGHCLLQPGSERFTLSNVSTADLLFVVDESGSMSGEQAELALNFHLFIENLDRTNAARADAGLQPIDFHIAVTTSSVFWNPQTTQTCRSDCTGAEGELVCCTGTTPARQPRRCTSTAQCPGTTTCRMDCNRLNGEFYCCAADGSFPGGSLTELIPCSRQGIACGTMERHYDFRGCSNHMTPNEWPYPQGDFVSYSTAPGTAAVPNPRVLHFDKKLYGPDAVNDQGFTRAQLLAWFEQNIQVGICGSGEEQVLQAGRLALQKAFAGQQKDTRDAGGGGAWIEPVAPTTIGGATAPARWPNSNSKLVVVFMGDEDDCSSPADPSGGVVMLSEAPGADACSRDASTAPPLGGKQTPVGDFVSYIANIKRFGRQVAAAFILPAAQVSCTLATCTDAGVCCPPGGCTATEGAQARGTRLLAAAHGLADAGVEVVAGSICDNFAGLLEDIAEIVKPPQTLTLPTEPAESRITLLRIASSNGDTRKLCGQPLAPGAYADVGQAQATGADWWFTQTKDPGVPVALSQYVYINPQGSCRANPGETYSADYLGVVPAGGCADPTECADKLGGQASSWECFVPPGLTRGTCTCATP